MKHTLIILALITATIQTFAQSPRIKLNQITKDSVTGSVLISSPTDSGMVYSRDLFISYGADTFLILGVDTIALKSDLVAEIGDSLVNYVSRTELSDSTTNIRTDIPLIISDSLTFYVSRTELSDSTTNIRTDIPLIVADSLLNYVNISGTQTITGAKTFSTDVEIDGKLDLNATGNSVFIGQDAGINDDGSNRNNTAIGYEALTVNSEGERNTATGYQSLRSNTGNYNTATGFQALFSNTANNNTAVSYQSLYFNSTGSNNTAIGYRAGRLTSTVANNTDSDNSVFIGYDTRPLADAQTNQIVIGYEARGLGSNSVMLGNSAITKTRLQGDVGIGTDSPDTDLEVVASDASNGIFIERAGADRIKILGDGTLFWGQSADYGRLSWDTDRAEIYGLNGYDLSFGAGGRKNDIWIDEPNGNVGIGTTSPSAKLDVVGDVEIDGKLDLNDGSNRVFVGTEAGTSNTGASSNGFGFQALKGNTGTQSNGFGRLALEGNSGANSNGFGYFALQSNSGIQSNGFGSFAGYDNGGSQSNGFGYAALSGNTGDYANGFGHLVFSNNSGTNNTAIGHEAGYEASNLTGGSNTFLGANASYGANTTINNATAVGANVTLSNSNTVILGNGADVGIGTTSPSADLDVVGDVEVNGNLTVTGTINNEPTNKQISLGEGYADNIRKFYYDSSITVHPSNLGYSYAELIKEDLLNEASLILTPTATSVGKLYTQKPLGSSDAFDFVRDSVATRVNSLGLIETVADSVPRIDYTDGEPSLLLEPSRTNEMAYSSDFNSWNKTNAPTVTTNIFIAPDGTLTADGIQNEDTLNAKYISYSVGGSVSVNSTYTATLFIKKETSETGYGGIGLTYSGGTLKYARVAINAVNGTTNLLSGSTITPTINMIDFNSNWWKIEITATDNGSNTSLTFFYFAHISSDFTTSNTTGVSSVRTIWGAQLEEGSYPTSYIPTNGSTVTRAADVATNAGDTTIFNDSKGVLYAELSALVSAEGDRTIAISDGTTSNRVYLSYIAASNTVNAIVVDGGSSQASISVSDIQTINSKLAIKYKANDVAFWVDGVEVGTDTSATMPSGLSELAFDDGGGSNPFYGNVKSVKYFPTALTDSEIEALTQP